MFYFINHKFVPLNLTPTLEGLIIVMVAATKQSTKKAGTTESSFQNGALHNRTDDFGL